MKRLFLVVGIAAGAVGLGPAQASAATVCVGSGAGCVPTLEAALAGVANGDTIAIGPGTFAGGVTVDVSVDIRGAGSGATTIQGGGPVLTIGKEFADSEPTVSISGVTVTGGVNTSVPDHAVTQGGGIRIPQAGSFPFTTGATVTITDSVLTGNKVASQQLLPPGLCSVDCSFASGGGISNDGDLTLIRTRVINNQAGDPSSLTVVATAGGISSSQRGRLTLIHSVVSGNRAIATPPYGAAADGGGIATRGPAVIDHSVISGNSAELSSTIATNDLGPVAIAGGLHIAEGGSATVTHSIVSDNRVSASGTADLVVGVAGGIDDDGSLVLNDSTVAHNQTSASVPATSPATVIVGGAMDIDGVATIRKSRFVGNRGSGSAPAGTVFAGGGAIGNFGQITLEQTVVTANSLSAIGASGSAQGGGIGEFSNGGPDPSLTVTDSVIAGNSINARAGITIQGGGLFTSFPVTLTRTVIAGNRPDQCFGC